MSINRREFLLGLASLGALPLLGSVELDSIADIDEVWGQRMVRPFL
jgi:hypothetical protein